MKLSEAIRLGAMLKPQAKYEWLTADGRTCALGAAMDAIGVRPVSRDEIAEADRDRMRELWAATVLRAVSCPECGEVFQRVDSAIIHLNNWEDWTREQIADWVESIECAQEQPVPEQQVTA